MMKQYFLLILLSLSVLAFSQEPIWLTSNGRELIAPCKSNYSGFAQDLYNQSKSSECIAKIKDKANAYLVESIVVSVKSVTESYQTETEQSGRFSNKSDFSSNVQTSSSAIVPNTHVDYFIDANKKYIYAFAYANKTEVMQFYEAKVGTLNRNIDSDFELIDKFVQAGNKQKARDYLTTLGKSLDTLRCTENVLLSINQQDTVICKSHLYKSQFEILTTALEDTKIFVEVNEVNNNQKSTIFTNKLLSQLEYQGAVLVKSLENADYHLVVDASTRKHPNNNSEFIFVYATATYVVKNVVRNEVVMQNEISVKSGDIDAINAGKKSLISVANQVSEELSKVLLAK